MPNLSPYDLAHCTTLLEAAARARIGIIVRTNGTTIQARAMLYEARKGMAPEFRAIQLRFSPDDPDNDLWAIRMAAEPESVGAGAVASSDIEI